MGIPGRTATERIAALATRNHGVVTRGQLLAAGLSTKQIASRVRAGLLLVEYPGVYRVGHRAPSTPASYLAAVRASGPGALLADRAAAYNFEILRGDPPQPTVITRTERRLAGVGTRRSRGLDRADATSWRGIPTLSLARTLVDLAATMPVDDLARACHEAGVRYRTTPRHVDQVLHRRPNATGARKLREILGGEAKVSLSRLESRFLSLLRDAHLALPETNRPAGGQRVDCRWPNHRLTVELDGFRFHNSRYAWEQDHRRERRAYARGDQFRRYTYGDVFEHPAAMLTELSCLVPRIGTPDRTAARIG